MFRKLDLFLSSCEGRETPTVLGPLERTNLKWNTSSYKTLFFLVTYNSRQWTKSRTPVILSLVEIYHSYTRRWEEGECSFKTSVAFYPNSAVLHLRRQHSSVIHSHRCHSFAEWFRTLLNNFTCANKTNTLCTFFCLPEEVIHIRKRSLGMSYTQ
jgi:hypothetical protein